MKTGGGGLSCSRCISHGTMIPIPSFAVHLFLLRMTIMIVYIYKDDNE